MKKIVFILIICSVLFKSCEMFEQQPPGTPVARVEDTFLYKEDISALIAAEMSEADSALVVANYIDRWATRQLLMDGARRNISLSEQQRLDNLAKQYKEDLYAQAYKDALVAKTIDTSISDDQAREVYEERAGNFKLNEDLYKLRYIHLNESDYDTREIKQRFRRYDTIDKKYLDSISIQFKAQSLNDSIWVDKATIISKIQPITAENETQYLKKTDFLELRDSLGLYLISIRDHLERNEKAPLEYVKPTIKQIILNKRKLELIKELEKDITKDAIKNKQFEIYK